MSSKESPPPHRRYIWTYINILLFLLVLARLYAYAITFKVVPDFPDPVLAFLARITEKTETTLDPVSLIVGPLVFGVLLKWYSPKHEESGAEKGQSSPVGDGTEKPAVSGRRGKKALKTKNTAVDVDGKKEKKDKVNIKILEGKKQAIIVVGRLIQCSIFIWNEYKGGARTVELSKRIFDLVVSAMLAYAELNGWKWDNGYIDKGLVRFWRLIGRDDNGNAQATEKLAEEEVIVAGPGSRFR